VMADSAFRIASMTKSFTVLAILKLRDEGKLSLEDPVSKWIPEFARIQLPTRDSAPLKVRQLLSHSTGWPEDNPWGDQQLSSTDDQVTQWLLKGIPFSTPPDTRYEYSNYAFGLLGRVVARASGVQYEKYVKSEILAKLHMDSSAFQFSELSASQRAVGYRIRPDGTYSEEPPLPEGAFSSAGGLLTTAADLGKYIAFHLSAWPPRDDGETGPVRRSSVREMSHMWTPSNLTASVSGGKLEAVEAGYGYGLRISTDCRFEHIVGHGGGLPGFGSYMMWLPDYGVGLFAMANLTYSGPSEPISQALDVMLKTGGLRMAFLSNFTTAMLDQAVKNTGLEGIFDDHLSTDRVMAFKPDTQAYRMAIDAFGLRKEEIAFAAFAGWDAAGAKWARRRPDEAAAARTCSGECEKRLSGPRT